MKIKNSWLYNLKGETLKQNVEGHPPLTVADVLIEAACSPPPIGQSYSPQQTSERRDFAKSLVDAKIGDDIEVPTPLAPQLDVDVSRVFNVIVAGAIHELLK